ncbi:MAG: hypothetical protein JKY65_14365 [Planctomycetes bacterium]|nr:hypothetical protein [Planctomycetota bacterium]
MSRVNKIRYKQFVQQTSGAKVFEIHVNREDKSSAVVLKFNGRAPRGKLRFTGEWTISKTDKDEAALTAEVKEFLDMARKDFLIKRGANLEDEVYADPAQEEKLAK